MRKKITLFFALALLSVSGFAQTDCGGGRYLTEVFSAYTRTNDITYGANINLQGQNQSLEMDIWEPTGDNEPLRPIIVMEHGGSFVGGSKDAVDITSLADPSFQARFCGGFHRIPFGHGWSSFPWSRFHQGIDFGLARCG
jgi:acetyl esterase/lipase